MERIVIALGGNALDNGKSSIDEQIEKASETFLRLSEIINNNEVVITYGNGPQVGEIYDKTGYPLDISGSMSQGLLLHILAMAYGSLKISGKLKKNIVPILTNTVIDENKYTLKPIGPFFDHKIDDTYAMEMNKGYRKMVKSPEPASILEIDSIINLVSNGYLPLAVGGGGVPVEILNKKYMGFQGVIDKDLSSSLLATLLNAKKFIIITDVNNVYLDFKNKSDPINKISYKQMLEYYNKIKFEEGTIKPKILAALRFIEHGGEKVYITSISNIENMESGTVIDRN
ncbi:carbamate kinase [Ferroplasma acidarmanus]|uniref:Carbamate kinase n=1 Tax=Ferroplasma acidarmanus Fer1 TaxID=333146 RepID=S0AM87_FERAC|nr:carbamate kinase [Ferroplasma acidarmanus]AGO60398.1 carbamate kinase [Ferroplasma acidarmanus Fer1]